MTTIRAGAPWTGGWVAERLELSIEDRGAVGGLAVRDLVGLALRRNPRRTHLLVSQVLGKHVPVRPSVATTAGRGLGRLVAAALDPSVTPVPPHRLRDALAGGGACDVPDAPVPVGLVLGFAETATGLGHLVADVLRAPYLHSTRRPVPGVAAAAGFEEAHSHAVAHLLLPADPALLDAEGTVVLVDDELSTGATAIGTIEALQRRHPRTRYVIACLVDLRDDDDRARIDDTAARLGCAIDVVALASGRLLLPPDVLTRGAALVAALPAPPAASSARPPVERVVLPLPEREGGRHGFTDRDRDRWEDVLPEAAAALAAHLPERGRLHVLGTEEFMALPLAVAARLEQRLPEASVTNSSTTRSPVAALDADGYAVRDAVAFTAHDAPADGSVERFAYNLGSLAPDVLVVMTDRAGDTPAVAELLAATGRTARRVLLGVPEGAP